MSDKIEILSSRQFLRSGSLDSVRVELSQQNGDDADDSLFFGGIYLSEEGVGHFCFYSDDLVQLALVAGYISDMAATLRDAAQSEIRKGNVDE